MVDTLLRGVAKCLLWLRYRVRVKGLDAVGRRGTRGVLFLPNHPALIDPFIVISQLHKRFRPRSLADSDQAGRPIIRWMARRAGAREIPSIARHGPEARDEIQQALAECVQWLRHGQNVVIYPAGRACRQRLEDLRGNSAAHRILQQLPEVRVVLVRVRGLWGSTFSWASGRPPQVGRSLRQALVSLLLNGVFFSPRRQVGLEFWEPDDLPRAGSREELNRYLEAFYNEAAPANTYVPYTIWERGGAAQRPEPVRARMAGDVASVPAATRQIVTQHLRELTGRDAIRDDELLAADLGLDSLARIELLVWLEGEFGFPQGDSDALLTVGDVLLAACGETASSVFEELKPVPAKWFADDPGNGEIVPPEVTSITDAFLAQARRSPGKVVVADQGRGAKTYRDLVAAILVLHPEIEKLEGDRVGILLPAGVVTDVLYLATLFAGKTPVMVNWTGGPRQVVHSLDLVGCRRVLTAAALLGRLADQGYDFGALGERFVRLEEVARAIPMARKLGAWLRSRLGWAALRRARVPQTAVILFTSGSESLPKAVPLTHANLLSNLADVLRSLTVRENDRLVGLLPPFHALGLTATMLAPLCGGLRTVYHPNPAEGALLARLIGAYRASLVIGTPTFLGGIVRAATREQLATLRVVITGAEKCPERVYAAVAERCPNATILEGYGVTECSPIISVNDQAAPKPYTIGKVLPSFEHAIVNVDTGERAAPGEPGVLLVRGPSVFGGYLNHDGPSPFADLEGKRWYRTGDLVSEDADGVLTFRGRLKRFVKLGGEMISLPAIESVLAERYPSDDERPTMAVEATPSDERPEIVLFTTVAVERAEANARLRQAGLSPLHNIRRVVVLEEIPLLGTGKTDYRALRRRLERNNSAGAP